MRKKKKEKTYFLLRIHTYVRTPPARPLARASLGTPRSVPGPSLSPSLRARFLDPLPHRRARSAYVRANLSKTRTSGFKEAAAAGDRSSSRDPTPERATPAWLWREPGAPMSDECDGARPPRASPTLGWGLGRRDNHLLLSRCHGTVEVDGALQEPLPRSIL